MIHHLYPLSVVSNNLMPQMNYRSNRSIIRNLPKLKSLTINMLKHIKQTNLKSMIHPKITKTKTYSKNHPKINLIKQLIIIPLKTQSLIHKI